ncbi:hypothetical protein EV701_109103 [Chthoniobacter flavus]|nr:hypothetical protein EV701_109103 [Chthoniobacter flavus]
MPNASNPAVAGDGGRTVEEAEGYNEGLVMGES